MKAPIAGALLALTLTAPATTARAQPPDPAASGGSAQAAALYEQGVKYYNVAQYEDAIEAFRKAYVVSEAPELLYDIAQSYRLEGKSHCAQALQFYRSYLRVAPTSPKRRAVEAAIRDMDACSREEPQAPASAEPAPAATTASTSRPATQTQPAQPAPAAAQAMASTPARGRSWLGPIVGGAGLALAAAGGSLLVWSRIDYVSLRDSGCAPSCAPSAVDPPRERQTIGSALLIAGGVAVVTGVVLWLFDRPAAPAVGAASGTIRF